MQLFGSTVSVQFGIIWAQWELWNFLLLNCKVERALEIILSHFLWGGTRVPRKGRGSVYTISLGLDSDSNDGQHSKHVSPPELQGENHQISVLELLGRKFQFVVLKALLTFLFLENKIVITLLYSPVCFCVLNILSSFLMKQQDCMEC